MTNKCDKGSSKIHFFNLGFSFYPPSISVMPPEAVQKFSSSTGLCTAKKEINFVHKLLLQWGIYVLIS